MPHVVTHTSEFRPFKWIGAAALACAVAFVLGLGYGQHNANQAAAKTNTASVPAPSAPAWCAGSSTESFGLFVADHNVPGAALYEEAHNEAAKLFGANGSMPVDPKPIVLSLALRCTSTSN